MKIFRDILTDLVEKRLWPVAALLLVLVAAVPMTLAKPGEAPLPPPVPRTVAEADTGPELTLTRAVTTGFSRAPHVSTKRLDPFADRTEAPTDAIVNSLKNSLTPIADPNAPIITTTVSGGGGDGGSGIEPVTPTKPSGGDDSPSTTPDSTVTTEKDDVISILVESGESDAEQLDDVRTLSPLPDTENPFLIYVGKTASDKASFLVASTATVTGPGSCDPLPTDCRTLVLAIGQTESFTVTKDDGTTDLYKITLVDLEADKKVTVSGSDEAVKAARLETKGRQVGAKVLLSQLKDSTVVNALTRRHVKIR